MGSPVSVTVANLVMEDIEERALEWFHTPILFLDEICWRYMSCHFFPNCFRNSINIWTVLNLQSSLLVKSKKMINSSSCFTIKRRWLLYLNNGYRKPTHTEHYLHFSSHHPQSHKQSLVRTLFSRAVSLSSSSLVRSTEEVHISEALQDNGYPREFINYNLHRPSNSQQIHQLTQLSATVVLSYIQGQSETIRRILQQLDIRTIFKPTLTLLRYCLIWKILFLYMYADWCNI